LLVCPPLPPHQLCINDFSFSVDEKLIQLRLLADWAGLFFRLLNQITVMNTSSRGDKNHLSSKARAESNFQQTENSINSILIFSSFIFRLFIYSKLFLLGRLWRWHSLKSLRRKSARSLHKLSNLCSFCVEATFHECFIRRRKFFLLLHLSPSPLLFCQL
jgi:hypothetical protein